MKYHLKHPSTVSVAEIYCPLMEASCGTKWLCDKKFQEQLEFGSQFLELSVNKLRASELAYFQTEWIDTFDSSV